MGPICYADTYSCRSRGFIIGIFAAVAVPTFIDFSDDANQSAVKNIAGSLASASSMNFSARTLNSNNGVAISDCQNAYGLLDSFPTGYAITVLNVVDGATATCTLTHTSSGETATFVIHGIN